MKQIAAVDDDKSLLDLYETLLEEEGYSVRAVALTPNLQQLVNNIKKFRPDMVILDVYLPGINSFEVLMSLREDPILINTPVLICSASRPALKTLQGRLEQAARPMPMVLEKPFNLDDLSKCVTELIGSP